MQIHTNKMPQRKNKKKKMKQEFTNGEQHQVLADESYWSYCHFFEGNLSFLSIFLVF